MNKAGRRGGTMGHSAARKSFKRLGKNCWFDVPKGYFTACFFASYPDIFSGKQNDVKKTKKKPQKKPWHGCKVQKRKKKRKERATRTKRKENKKKHK